MYDVHMPNLLGSTVAVAQLTPGVFDITAEAPGNPEAGFHHVATLTKEQAEELFHALGEALGIDWHA
jgi:hypothetical protein